ncbi:MAG: YihA family ribosome biogenesis GTP-binding protein [Chitinophagales bacterium]|nr:YihA family ribosome biogenesis GTP-binding protein [Chitinophagales bacterium]
MIIKSVIFIGSYTDVKKCPQSKLGEYAFAGRSNVGKSSLINMLSGFKNIARISTNPGKTQTMNYFLINDAWHLVDLPGYGFAKVSKDKRESWDKMIKKYLYERENLICVFQLVDGSIEPQKLDIEFTNWMGEHSIPFALIFTKTDKKNRTTGSPVALYEKELLQTWETLPKRFITSARSTLGKDEILKFIAEAEVNDTNSSVDR